MKKLFTFIILTIGFTVSAQIGINNENPDASAALDITSTTGGLLPPRMTNAQRDAISAPATGLMVYVTDLNGGSIMIYNGTNWSVLSTTSTLPDAPIIGTATAGVAQASIAFTAPTSNGGSTITSYTATSNPGSISGSLSQSGSGNITVTGLTNNTAYTFTVTATNQNGTSVASASSNSVTPTAPPEVGDFYQGGVVFYIYQSGDTGYVENETHGLIVSVSHVSTATWGPIADVATSNAIGTGLANTNLMSSQVGSGAANACLNYSAGGYSDWFLPSKDELQLIVNNKSIINSVSASNGGSSFTSGDYWASSQSSNRHAYTWWTGSSSVEGGTNKYTTGVYSRAIRAF